MEAHIAIPVQGTDEEVLVSTSELPAEPEDLLELLKGEIAPLSIWLDFAKAYLAAGRVRISDLWRSLMLSGLCFLLMLCEVFCFLCSLNFTLPVHAFAIFDFSITLVFRQLHIQVFIFWIIKLSRQALSSCRTYDNLDSSPMMYRLRCWPFDIFISFTI